MLSEEDRRNQLLHQPSYAGPGSPRLLEQLHRTHAAVNLIVAYASSLNDGLFGPVTSQQRTVLGEIIGGGQAIADVLAVVTDDVRLTDVPVVDAPSE